VVVEEDEPEAVLDDDRVLCEEVGSGLGVLPVERCGPSADDGCRAFGGLRLGGACPERDRRDHGEHERYRVAGHERIVHSG
jgi:hypothetical protein